MIKYVTGDATKPQGTHPIKIIAHVCNNVGAWGAGFVLALDKLSPRCKENYLMREKSLYLGRCFWTNVDDGIFVWNMVAQSGLRSKENPKPISYSDLDYCLQQLYLETRYQDPSAFSIHMPRIGCGLAGGDWGIVEPLITRNLIEDKGLNVYVYDLP